MNFNKHYELKDKHAILGASNHAWINYDEDKLRQRFLAIQAIELGRKYHEFASKAIELGERLQGNKSTLSMYVRDAIGFKMATEQPLYYSPNAFGTCDAISFKNNELRIHDLKTGVTPASMDQLMIYAALFCLEYQVNPSDIYIELRIYQSNNIIQEIPNPEDIKFIMDKIVNFDKIINSMKE